MTLEEFKKALDRTDEIELTIIGRKTGRQITNPVWFVREGDKLYLLPVKGSDSEWYKNVLQNPAITLTANGVSWTTKAKPITDATRVQDVVEQFRAKYGADDVRKYYSKFDVAVEAPLA